MTAASQQTEAAGGAREDGRRRRPHQPGIETRLLDTDGAGEAAVRGVPDERIVLEADDLGSAAGNLEEALRIAGDGRVRHLDNAGIGSADGGGVAVIDRAGVCWCPKFWRFVRA